MNGRKVRKRKFTLGKYLLLTFLSLALLMGIFGVIKVIREAVWDGQSKANLIIDSDEIYLASFDPQAEKLAVVSIPAETYIGVPFGFGFYPFGSVYDLGEMEKRGGEVLALAAQEFFATPVEGWVKLPKGQLEIKNREVAKREIAKLLGRLMRSFGGEEAKTNLTVLDKVRLWWQIRNVRFDKVTFYDLEESGVTQTPSLGRIDTLLGPFLADEKIQEESLKIAVLNSTGESGLGNRIGRLITNLGGEVITLGNIEGKFPTCLIKAQKEDLSKKTVQKLKKIYSCNVEGSEVLENRADLVFIVGEDYRKKVTGKD